MDCSMEMKLQAIDKMIEMRNQLIGMQENLRMSNGFTVDGSILVFETNDLIELSKAVEADIHKTGYITKDGFPEIAFEYKGIKFNTYDYSNDYERYENQTARGDEDD